MTLQRIHDDGVFDDATTDERRAQVYVRSGELGLPTRLPADADDPPLSLILERRMERDGIVAALDSVIDRSAVEELQVLYHERQCDLRSVLRLAHNAAGHALGRGCAVIAARDVRAVVCRRVPLSDVRARGGVQRSSADDGAQTLVLASRSPQRRAILRQLGIAFEVLEVDVEELTAGDPIEIARTNALRKAQAGAQQRPHDTVLGVDTVVALDGEIFGKPPSAEAASATLKRLSGRTHEVVSGLALVKSANPQVVHEVTKVTFRALDDTFVRRYVETGEWSGRAGGYAIQGIGAGLVRRIMGDYLNVVGLPVGKMLDLDLTLMLRQN